MAIFLLMTFSGPAAFGYGGGGGGGGGDAGGDSDGSTGTSMTDFGGSSGSNPPAGFNPFNPANTNPFETHWDFEGEEAKDTGNHRGGKSEQQRREEQEQADWIKETTVSVGGSALLGWATGGYSIYIQVITSGVWAGGTTYYYSDGDAEASTEATIQDSIIASTPLGPIPGAIASPILTELREQAPAQPHRTRRQELEAITPNFLPANK
jgi:hypothetical protein